MAGDESQFHDELGAFWHLIEAAHEAAQTQEEHMVLVRIAANVEYGRKLALQREFPTPNQKLVEMCGGDEPEQPPHPGDWGSFYDDYTETLSEKFK